MKKPSSRSERDISVWFIVGWVLLVVVGIGLAWYGFVWSERDRQPAAVQPSATPVPETVPPTATLPPSPTASNTPVPTDTPLPTAAPEPTAIPATATPPPATIVVGAGGVNVRSGPGTNYTRLGSLDPGTQARVTGQYGDWWQIQYNGEPAWVFGELVTASNADNVPQVEPPPAPTAAPTAASGPTAVPPTATAAPAADFRGLVPDKFEVEGAPGPYAVGQEIRFHMWITNKTGSPVEYEYLGVQVEETGEVQKSWTYSQLPPNQQFYHNDHMQDKISAAGTYHLWLVIRFRDGAAFRLLGPVEVIVQ